VRSGRDRAVDALASRNSRSVKGHLSRGLPRSRARGDDEALLRGRSSQPGIDAIERAFDASKYGRVSDSLVFRGDDPSLVDPSLVAGAPDGTHVVSVIASTRRARCARVRGTTRDGRRGSATPSSTRSTP